MTSSILVGLLIAAAVIPYWMLCRKRSLPIQARAVELLTDLYADESVSDKEKLTAHFNYLMVQRWYYLPFLVVVMPFFLIFSLIFSRKGLPAPADDSTKHRDAMDSVVMIYLTRNPITAALSFTVIILMAMPVVLVALLLNRIKRLPSLTALTAAVSTLIAENLMKPSRRARAH